MTESEEYDTGMKQWEVDQRTTLEDLEETLDEMKRLFHKGEYHEMPAPIMRGRQQIQELKTRRDSSDPEQGPGAVGYCAAEPMRGEQDRIEEDIRKDATRRFSPLPDGSHADPDDWNVEYWVIEDSTVHYRVTHPDYPFESEVECFDV